MKNTTRTFLGLALLSTLAMPSALSAADAIETEIPADRIPARRANGRAVLIENATILPVEGATLTGASLLIEKGRIAAIGRDLARPRSALVIDATGQFIMPGVIDCHSHIAIEGGVNEMAEKLSPEVRIGDVINHEDVSIYRAVAGGVTGALLLHGSANPIGGQAVVIKLRYGKSAPELVFKAAPRGIKFALGENPKRRGGFPKTRQGIMATMRRAFTAARDYEARWKSYREARARGETVVPPRRDQRLATYAGILSGEIKVHCHCYRADEIAMLIKIADEFGFKIATFQHVLEGYKVASEIARHGAGASTFSDWWAYKIEAFDAIPHNAALMTRAGIVTSINSDSAELIRHLPLEAAKSARYGGLSENEILRLVTLNPAIQLGVGERTGSIKVGKDADLSIWNGHPLSVFSRVVMTLIDGEIYFDKQGPRHSDLGATAFKVPGARKKLKIKRNPGDVYAVRGARIMPVSRPPFSGDIVLSKGRILALGADVSIPSDAQVIDGEGLTVSPGFIDAGTQLGLTEIGSADETQDTREAGTFQPDLRAIEGVNPQSELIPVTRLAGTTMALTSPSGGILAGQASLIHLKGWVADEMAVVPQVGMTLQFPAASGRGRRRGGGRAGAEDGTNARLEALEKFLDDASSYLRLRAARPGHPVDLRYQALAPYLRGERPFLVSLGDAKAMIECVEWAKKRGYKLILRGARDAWKIADYLAERQVPVLVGPVMSVPRGAFTPYDSAYRNPARLQQAGVRFAIQSNEASNARLLPFEAGMAAAFGLSPAQALRSITLSPAEILGIDGDYGSLDKGKVADVILSHGHPLEPSSRVVGMFIAGRPVSLESKQTKLFKRFRKRLRGIQGRASGMKFQ